MYYQPLILQLSNVFVQNVNVVSIMTFVYTNKAAFRDNFYLSCEVNSEITKSKLVLKYKPGLDSTVDHCCFNNCDSFNLSDNCLESRAFSLANSILI